MSIFSRFFNRSQRTVEASIMGIERSVFDRSSTYKTTFNFGDLIPCYVDEVLPSSSWKLDPSLVCRMATPIFPVMDNAYLDMFFFFVPARILWEHWKEFMGENDVSAWLPATTYYVPQVEIQTSDFTSGNAAFSVADYMGLPVDAGSGTEFDFFASLLPFRAYGLIWNEYFRDQDLQDPLLINRTDSYSGSSADSLYKKAPLKACKFPDMFTKARPAPQKGPDVLIPGLGTSVPVTTTTQPTISGARPPVIFKETYDGTTIQGSGFENSLYMGQDGGLAYVQDELDVGSTGIYPSNLATVAGAASGATISALRSAWAILHLFERDSYGTRYREILRNHFGALSPDATQQVPEYLGGKRIPLNMSQVLQQSATDTVSPQGNTAAFSKTVDSFAGFEKSFTEHGYVIGVMCARTDHTYQQGLDRMWSRRERFEFYFPALAHVSNMPILNKELMVTDPAVSDTNDDIFGYRDAWDEYRFKTSKVTGAFRSSYSASLDSWHYADYYATRPTLSDGFVKETEVNVNRTLAVQASSTNHDQLIIDIFFKCRVTNPMPAKGIPGLVDHF